MTLKLKDVGEIRISKIQHLDSDEYKVLDIESLFKIAETIGLEITEAYITEYENQTFLVIYPEIPEDLLLFCEDCFVFPVENMVID